ncbi:hypothetical protein TcWFU_005342 [Taenia crassiceps]|uniref:Fibronectin type-III domain-containing protein n=1 Tax=Taenia crassiceps TaxID=6207 RepID=A0ABR4Q0I8_9CEST
MWQRCVVVVILLGGLLRASARDAAITWPDPRHFTASIDRRSGNALTLSWPVSYYCGENGLLNFSASITRVGDDEFGMNVSRAGESVDVVLEQGEAEYRVVAEMKTKFNVGGVSAAASVRTGDRPLFGSLLSLPVQAVSPVRAVDDGPFVVVLRHDVRAECLLIIYDANVTAGNYTIEATDLCGEEERASMAIALAIRKQALDLLPKMHLLKFDLPSGLLEALPRFSIQTYSVPNKAHFELDAPCDVYGKLELTSPRTARLTVTFRPPASHPRLIHNFTFVFSHANETIVVEVIDDTSLSNQSTANAIGYEAMQRAQRDRAVHFEVRPSASYEYPGNYTVTAFTNNAVNKKVVHCIIMPEFVALQPHIMRSRSRGLVNASRVIQQPQFDPHRVTFYTLTPATNYSIMLGSNCTGGEPFWTHLGDVETEAGVPGVPRDVKLTQIGAKAVKLTWDAPLVLPGRHHYYEWSCRSENTNASIGGKVEDTYVVLTRVGPGILSCTVQAVMRTSGNMAKYGEVSSPVQLLVRPADLPQAPSVGIVPVNETTVSFDVMPVLRPDVLGFIVTVDADLTISFCLGESSGPLSVNNNGTLAVRALRTGPASFLLTGLTPYHSYSVNITTLFSIDHNTMRSCDVRLVPPGYDATASSSTAPVTTVPTSTVKKEEEEEEDVTTERNVTMDTTEAVSTTAQQAGASPNTEPSDHGGSEPAAGQASEGNVNVTTVLLAVFGCMGTLLLVAIAGLIVQKWREKNAAKMFENPPPAGPLPLNS